MIERYCDVCHRKLNEKNSHKYDNDATLSRWAEEDATKANKFLFDDFKKKSLKLAPARSFDRVNEKYYEKDVCNKCFLDEVDKYKNQYEIIIDHVTDANKWLYSLLERLSETDIHEYEKHKEYLGRTVTGVFETYLQSKHMKGELK